MATRLCAKMYDELCEMKCYKVWYSSLEILMKIKVRLMQIIVNLLKRSKRKIILRCELQPLIAILTLCRFCSEFYSKNLIQRNIFMDAELINCKLQYEGVAKMFKHHNNDNTIECLP